MDSKTQWNQISNEAQEVKVPLATYPEEQREVITQFTNKYSYLVNNAIQTLNFLVNNPCKTDEEKVSARVLAQDSIKILSMGNMSKIFDEVITNSKLSNQPSYIEVAQTLAVYYPFLSAAFTTHELVYAFYPIDITKTPIPFNFENIVEEIEDSELTINNYKDNFLLLLPFTDDSMSTKINFLQKNAHVLGEEDIMQRLLRDSDSIENGIQRIADENYDKYAIAVKTFIEIYREILQKTQVEG